MCGCSVTGCKNVYQKGGAISMFRFPKDPKCQKLWVKFCQRPDNLNMNNARLCSDHFPPSDFERDLMSELLNLRRRHILKPNAVPTVYPPSVNNVDEPLNHIQPCRICLILLDMNTAPHTKIDKGEPDDSIPTAIGHKIKNIIPEMDLNIAKISIVCNSCRESLETLFEFKMKCLKIEETIKKYAQSKGKLDLKKIVIVNLRRTEEETSEVADNQEAPKQPRKSLRVLRRRKARVAMCNDIPPKKRIRAKHSEAVIIEITPECVRKRAGILRRPAKVTRVENPSNREQLEEQSGETTEVSGSDKFVQLCEGENKKFVCSNYIIAQNNFLSNVNLKLGATAVPHELNINTINVKESEVERDLTDCTTRRDMNGQNSSDVQVDSASQNNETNSVTTNLPADNRISVSKYKHCRMELITRKNSDGSVYMQLISTTKKDQNDFKSLPKQSDITVIKDEINSNNTNMHVDFNVATHMHSDTLNSAEIVFQQHDHSSYTKPISLSNVNSAAVAESLEKNVLLSKKSENPLSINLIESVPNILNTQHFSSTLQCDILPLAYSDNDIIIDNEVYINMEDCKDMVPVVKNKFGCPVCTKNFIAENDLNAHTRIHYDEEINRCKVCNLGYKEKLAFKDHMAKHSIHLYSCEACGEICQTKLSLQEHKRGHKELVGNNICTFCSRRFVKRTDLEDHLKDHLRFKRGNILEFVCSICKRKFSSKNLARQHVMQEHKIVSESR